MPALAEHLKSTISHKTIQSKDFEGIKDTLLISIPNSTNKEGLVLLQKGQLHVFNIFGCTGLWEDGDRLFIAEIVSPDHMSLKVLQVGQPTITIVSSLLGDIHDVRIFNGELIVVSTGTNEVVKIDMAGRILESWKLPGFGDSSHINCLDVWDNRLVATAFGKFTTYRGYKGKTKNSGILYDICTEEVLYDGFSAPHTPRRDQSGAVYVCDSRNERLSYRQGSIQKELVFPGAFTRGLCFSEEDIYVGLSSLRNRADLMYVGNGMGTAQIGIVDRKTFETKRRVAIPQGEIYDLLILSD